MDSFAKQYGCTVSLGQIFWESVTNSNSQTKVELFPLVRVSLCMGHLASPNIEDGIAKTLTKTDIAKVTHKDKLPMCRKCGDTRSNALELVVLVSDMGTALRPLDKAFVRVGLLVTDKGLAGPEKEKHALCRIVFGNDIYDLEDRPARCFCI